MNIEHGTRAHTLYLFTKPCMGSYVWVRSEITRLGTILIKINDQRRKISIAFNAVDMDLRIKGSEIWSEEQGLESGV